MYFLCSKLGILFLKVGVLLSVKKGLACFYCTVLRCTEQGLNYQRLMLLSTGVVRCIEQGLNYQRYMLLSRN
ncbi:unnamed protein product [Urochloa humidicola]